MGILWSEILRPSLCAAVSVCLFDVGVPPCGWPRSIPLAGPAGARDQAAFGVSAHAGCDRGRAGYGAGAPARRNRAWNRAIGSRAPVDPTRALRRLPASLACHADFQRQRVASGESCANPNGAGGVCLPCSSAGPIRASCARVPLPCLLPPRNPRAPGDPARTAPGAMGSAISLLPVPGQAGSAAARGRCTFVVCRPLVAAVGMLGLHPVRWDFCQEINDME